MKSGWIGSASCLIPCLMIAVAARSQTLPPSVAACADETDVLKRLSCYDREVPRFLPHERATPAGKPEQPAPQSASEPSGSASQAAQPAGGTPAIVAAGSRGTANLASPSPSARPSSDPSTAARAKLAPHLRARILSIEHYPSEIVLHLDNGQVWQQVEEGSADLGLHAGDTVSIDRALGSYWITGRHGATAKVRLKQ